MALVEVPDGIESWSAEQVLAWTARAGRATFGTGFGAEGCVLIHLIADARLPIDVFTLDTGLLFPETYTVWRALEARYGITIRARPAGADGRGAGGGARTGALGARPHALLRASEARAAAPARSTGNDLWVTAIRRDQTAERADAPVVERDKRYGLLKVNPLVALDLEGRLGIHPGQRCALQPAARRRLPEHRVLAVHDPCGRRGGSARRTLARVPEERMRPPPEDGPVDDPSQGRHSS